MFSWTVLSHTLTHSVVCMSVCVSAKRVHKHTNTHTVMSLARGKDVPGTVAVLASTALRRSRTLAGNASGSSLAIREDERDGTGCVAVLLGCVAVLVCNHRLLEVLEALREALVRGYVSSA